MRAGLFCWFSRADSFYCAGEGDFYVALILTIINFGKGKLFCKIGPCIGYFTTITKVPAIINPAPITVLKVRVSPKNSIHVDMV